MWHIDPEGGLDVKGVVDSLRSVDTAMGRVCTPPGGAWPREVVALLGPVTAGCLQMYSSDRPALSDVRGAITACNVAAPLVERPHCVVCLLDARATRLHPCLHSVLCVACAYIMQAQNQGCPICRVPFTHFERGAFSQTYSP